MGSILNTVKTMLGIQTADTAFDTDIIVDINSALTILNQLGVGAETGFVVADATDTWEDFIGASILLEVVKTYVYLRVKLMFDPPSTSFVIESVNRQITELEWRISVITDPA